MDLPGLAVDLDLREGDRVGTLVVGGVESVLQRFDEQVEGNALFLLYLPESLYCLLVHSLPYLNSYFRWASVISPSGMRAATPASSISMSSDPTSRRTPCQTLRPSIGTRVFTYTVLPTWASKWLRFRSGLSMPGELTSRVYGPVHGVALVQSLAHHSRYPGAQVVRDTAGMVDEQTYDPLPPATSHLRHHQFHIPDLAVDDLLEPSVGEFHDLFLA